MLVVREKTMVREEQLLALVRHGHSFANEETEKPARGFFYKLSGSDKSVGVTERGFAQCDSAGELISWLFPEYNQISQVWVSEYLRTEESARTILGRLPYAPSLLVDPRLNKREYGKFWNMTYRGVEHLHPQEFGLYKEIGALKYRPPEGENYFDLFKRTQLFVNETLNPSTGNQMIVGHSASLLALMRELEGLDDSEVVRQYHCVSIPNGHVILYARSNPSQKWRRLSVAEQSLARR